MHFLDKLQVWGLFGNQRKALSETDLPFRIHGIQVYQNTILVWGGLYASLYQVDLEKGVNFWY